MTLEEALSILSDRCKEAEFSYSLKAYLNFRGIKFEHLAGYKAEMDQALSVVQSIIEKLPEQ
jgi:hypothetical protein